MKGKTMWSSLRNLRQHRIKDSASDVPEKMQADDVLSRQAVFMRCCLNEATPSMPDERPSRQVRDTCIT